MTGAAGCRHYGPPDAICASGTPSERRGVLSKGALSAFLTREEQRSVTFVEVLSTRSGWFCRRPFVGEGVGYRQNLSDQGWNRARAWPFPTLLPRIPTYLCTQTSNVLPGQGLHPSWTKVVRPR